LSETLPTRSRLNIGAVVATAFTVLTCLFTHLAAIGFVGPDEPRYAWIARNMAATGDWITPQLYARPWFEKPILYYWAAAVGFRMHLPAEWAGRLPSAVAALAAALALGWLGWKHYGNSRGYALSPALLAPLLFSTCVGTIGFARAAGPDMLFNAALALAMASAAGVLLKAAALRGAPSEFDRASRNDAVPLILFGAFLGLAVLAKGPAGLVLAGGAIGIWALATKQWRVALHLAHPFAIVAFAIVALPWYVLCASRNPDFIRIFIFSHNFSRYLTPVFQHRQPFWFFVPIVFLALIPWTAFLIPVAQEGLRLWHEKSWKDSPGFYFASWAVFPIVFFSFSQSKLPGYVLPAIPPLALLCSVGVVRTFEKSRAAAFGLAATIAVTWGGLIALLYHVMRRIPGFSLEPYGLTATTNAIILLVALLAVAVALAGFRRKIVPTIAFCAFAVLLSVEFAGLRILPSLDPFLSSRSAAESLDGLLSAPTFSYHLKPSWNYGLAFYLGREIPEWTPDNSGAAAILTSAPGLEDLKNLQKIRGQVEEAQPGIFLVHVEPALR
jgi:4-amino-4-deoxy-L-arabinose transferase-like glycosyltransferase